MIGIKSTSIQRVICFECNGIKTIRDNTGDSDTCPSCNGEGMLDKITTVEHRRIEG